MRLVALSIGLAAAVVASSCSSETPTNPVASAGSAGFGGATGAAGGAGGATAAGTSGVGGKSGASGFGGESSAGSAGSAGAPEGSDAGASGSGDFAGAGGTPSGGGPGTAGTSAGGASAGSGGSSGSCGAVSADKRVFVSSALYTGALGGLDGADSKCQTMASKAGLCGTFKAWLSDDSANAADRLTHATGKYLLMNDQVIANGWAELTSGTLQHAIDLTEKQGAALVGTVKCGGSSIVPVWTGAPSSGVAVANGSCANWATNGTGPGAAFGNAAAKNAAWSGTCQLTTVCADTAALYCVEQ